MADRSDRAHEQWGTYLTVFVKCQKIKHLDYGGGSQKKKKKIDTMRFTHIDVNFDVTYDGH